MTVDGHHVLDDRYALDELIGRGGAADVYRATDRLLLREVAVKLLRELTEPGERERFVGEARTLASLNHTGLITLLDAGIEVDRPYLVMELATGPTLAACIQEAPIESTRLREVGRQLAEAIAYAHGQGIVHRDVKPSNVLVCDDDRVLLADFGIARLVGAAQHQTRTGMTIGSPAYLAPEQVAGESVGPAADVYSLGLVLLEALTGVRAYPGSPIEAAAARLHAGPSIPTSLEPGWRALLAEMTDRDPRRRPDAADVAHGLARLGHDGADGAAVPAADAAEATQEEYIDDGRPGDARARKRSMAIALGGLLVVAALAVVLVLAPWHPARRADADTVVPASVPSKLQAPLADLHAAVEGHP